MALLQFCLLVACALVSLQQLPTTGAQDSNMLSRMSASIYEFTFEFYNKITESNTDGNVFFSPTSIYVCLAMLYAGTDGDTKNQLSSALHLDSLELADDMELYTQIKMLIQTLQKSNKDYTLKMANRLFALDGLSFEREYLRITKNYFLAQLQEEDFDGEPSKSRSDINKWVSKMTSSKIGELFPKDAITSETILVLASAVYFKSPWMKMFEKGETKPDTFYLANGKEVKVQMMSLSDRLSYFKSEDFACQVLELPYSAEKVSMIIILPNEVDGIAALEERLRDSSMSEVFYSLRLSLVKLYLPRLAIQQSMNMKETFQAFGVDVENADFSGIETSHALQLSEAIHKSYLTVNESGSEVTGATGEAQPVTIITDVQEYIDFKVDRPFLFLVIEQSTGCTLFLGRVTNPLKKN